MAILAVASLFLEEKSAPFQSKTYDGARDKGSNSGEATKADLCSYTFVQENYSITLESW